MRGAFSQYAPRVRLSEAHFAICASAIRCTIPLPSFSSRSIHLTLSLTLPIPSRSSPLPARPWSRRPPVEKEPPPPAEKEPWSRRPPVEKEPPPARHLPSPRRPPHRRPLRLRPGALPRGTTTKRIPPLPTPAPSNLIAHSASPNLG